MIKREYDTSSIYVYKKRAEYMNLHNNWNYMNNDNMLTQEGKIREILSQYLRQIK